MTFNPTHTSAPRAELLAEPALVIFDMDGVLLSLALDSERVRGAIRQRFAAAGIARDFRPLLATLEEACATVAASDPARADALREEAWAEIDAEERRAAGRCRRLPGARRLLAALRARGVPFALFTNNHHQAALDALEAASLDPAWFFAIEARREARSLKPSAAPVLRIVEATPGPPPRTVYLVGDHPLDMASAVLARDKLATAGLTGEAPQIVPVALLPAAKRVDPAPAAELERRGAWLFAADLDEAATLLFDPPWGIGRGR